MPHCLHACLPVHPRARALSHPARHDDAREQDAHAYRSERAKHGGRGGRERAHTPERTRDGVKERTGTRTHARARTHTYTRGREGGRERARAREGRSGRWRRRERKRERAKERERARARARERERRTWRRGSEKAPLSLLENQVREESTTICSPSLKPSHLHTHTRTRTHTHKESRQADTPWFL